MKVLTVAIGVLTVCSALGCVGDACHAPCNCTAGDGTDLECNDAGLTAVPCKINPSANGVYLSNNGIPAIAAGDFGGLADLQYIFLSNNKLTGIDGSALKGLSKLGELFAPNNRIATVSDDAFDGLDRSADTCTPHPRRPTNGPTSFFNPRPTLRPPFMLNSLAYIELNNNSLTVMPKLKGLGALTMLSLANNSIAAVPAGAFGSSPLLTSIELGRNAITTLPKGLFDAVPAMHQYYGRLCLGGNPLDCCGLEWLRDTVAALDATGCADAFQGGRATCASPAKVRGRALKDTKGTIC
jgi:hypothetical protein